jgi:hypothetical protein
MPPGDRTLLLACSVRSLRKWWLEVRCSCKTQFMPLRLMASNHELARLSLADVLIQLRCEKCREPPKIVVIVEDPAGNAAGRIAPPGWRVVLIGEDTGSCN